MSLRSTEGQKGLPAYFGIVFGLLKQIKTGSITMVLPDGREFLAAGPDDGPHGRIIVRDGNMFRRLVREGENAFPESYMESWWDTPDLMAVMDVMLMNNDQVGRSIPGAQLVRYFERFRHWLRSNSRAQAKKNISYHYDLGNDFYDT